MTNEQLAEWRRAQTAAAKAARNQRGRRRRGLNTVSRAGMVRISPPTEDVPAPGGEALKETP